MPGIKYTPDEQKVIDFFVKEYLNDIWGAKTAKPPGNKDINENEKEEARQRQGNN